MYKLENDKGIALDKDNNIVIEVLSFFLEYFYSSMEGVTFGIKEFDLCAINVERIVCLERPFEEDEMRMTLLDCEREGSRLDGFSMAAKG